MLDNIRAPKRDKWLLFPRFIHIILDYLKSNLAKLWDVLKQTPMNVRIFADCSSTRHDFSGKITYLFDNMYTDDRREYIQKLRIAEEKRFEDLRENIKADIKKRKKYVKEKGVMLEK